MAEDKDSTIENIKRLPEPKVLEGMIDFLFVPFEIAEVQFFVMKSSDGFVEVAPAKKRFYVAGVRNTGREKEIFMSETLWPVEYMGKTHEVVACLEGILLTKVAYYKALERL